jgi:flavin reductase (DIM6/NTAB) family NADH-FMN oxidoreductase RutF
VNFDITEISTIACYRLLIGAVVARPIAWVSTLSESGVTNLAPFSFFTVASCAPPVLAFVQVIPRDNSEKDTLRNLRETRQRVVNVAGFNNAVVMNATCADYPPSEQPGREKAGIADMNITKAVDYYRTPRGQRESAPNRLRFKSVRSKTTS